MKTRLFAILLQILLPLSIYGAVISVPAGTDTIQLAITEASSGDTLELASGTFDTTVTINVDKSLTIQGAGVGSSVIANVTNNTLVNIFSISASNVTMEDFTITHVVPSPISVEAAILVPENPPGQTGLVFNNLTIGATVFGFYVITSEAQITNCAFVYVGPTNNENFCIALYGSQGNTVIQNNTVSPSPFVTTGTNFVYVSSNDPFESVSGTLNVSNNTLIGPEVLRQFFVMDTFVGAPGSFSLVSNNNIFNTARGSYIFFGFYQDDFLDVFSTISINNNTDSSENGKGLVTLDGYCSACPVATDPAAIFISMSGNVLADTSITATGFIAAANCGLIGLNDAVFEPFFINFPPPAPVNLAVHRVNETFPTFVDRINVLTWDNPDSTIVSYIISRDSPDNVIAKQRAEQPSNTYEDHNRKKKRATTYYVRSVNVCGDVSLPATVTEP